MSATPESPDQVVFQPPPRTLTVPAGDEEVLMVPRRDWDRLYRCVGAITQSPKYMFNFAWTMIGVGTASILAWLPWQAADSQLSHASQLHYAWVSPVLVVGAIAAAILATFGFAVATTNSRQSSTEVSDVLEDMKMIHPPRTPAPPSSPPAAKPPRSIRHPVRGTPRLTANDG
jgi:hypothetical protein